MASHTPSFYSNWGCNLENRFIFSSRCGLKLSFLRVLLILKTNHLNGRSSPEKVSTRL